MALSLIVLSAGVAIAETTPAVAAPAERAANVGILNVWQYNYYQNHFSNEFTCKSRGETMLDTVQGMLNYACHKNSGEPKWSMDVLWSTA
ncbi:hypothetical protein ASE14_16615 [Agromyces sp. Root81]|nr:hypothetical protein ASE14_16615 [Agromyces sp. Root81]